MKLIVLNKDFRIPWIFFLLLFLVACHTRDNNQQEKDVASLSQAYQNQFKIGVALNRFQVAGEVPQAIPLITKHFNTITPENLLKWERVHPEPDQYNFDYADRFVDLGEANDMFIVGHTLVWHNQVPDWVFENENGEEINREPLLQRMQEHISTIVGHYKGRVDGWDVVNEAVLDEGRMRKSKWYNIIGEDFVEKAFQYANETDPVAELYYNDYNLWKPEKREAAINLVKRLQSQDIPVHGIGMQAHLGIDDPPIEMLEESIRAFSDLGVKVMITELDVDVLPKEEDVEIEFEDGGEVPTVLNPYQEGLPDSVQEHLSQRYADLFELFSKYKDNIDRVTFWGLNDGQSWKNNFPIRGRTNYPLLFDRNYQPKPAFYRVIEVSNE